MPESQPTPLGQYQLIEKIAQGGMAEIFRGKALDPYGIERAVVIKRILPHIAASPEFVEMLIDEAKIAVQLSHGNIAQVYDLGKVVDDYFIVMEYVEGKTLSQIMKRLKNQDKRMPVPHAVSICAEIAGGLDYMHRKTDESGHPLNIVHRDISPQNVIVSTAGTVKIIDFGIAKAKTKISTTDSGILKGKFAYMSPEHAEGERLDHRTDIFSLGIILHELLTGQRLFKGKNNPETIKKVKKAKVPVPSEVRSAIPRALDEIVLKALQRDRDKRYPSAHDLAQDLTKFLITRHPEFSPRDLIRFLQELFPEIAPLEKMAHEETPIVPIVIKKGKNGKGEEEEPHEVTAAADSQVLRMKLKETEVFHVPEIEKEEPEEEKEEKAEEEGTAKIPLARIRRAVIRFLAAGLVLGLVMGGGIYLYRTLAKSSWFTKKPETPPPLSPLIPQPSTITPQPLAAPSPSPFGTLSIDSAPRGAHIFLNDADTNKVTPAALEKIPAGDVQKIGLYLEKYRFWEGKIQVEGGKTAPLSISLDLNYGDLEINSLPEGADVVLNGQTVGKTPFTLAKVPPDSAYEVVLRRHGYEPWEGQVKIFGGKREVVNISLKKMRPE